MRADESARRLAALRGRLVDLELDGLLVTGPENIRYLSGFSGSLGYLVIGTGAAEILGDSRYWLQMEAEAPGFTLVRSGPSHGLWALIAERLKALRLRRVGFESQQTTVDQHQRLVAALPSELTLVPTSGLVEELRIIKSAQEVALLRAVASIAGRAFDRVRSAIRPGLRERDVAFLLEQTFRELGADGAAFETIVAAGERGALPHGRASDRVLERGDMVVVDFGATAAGYHSDTTRTIVMGEPSTEQARVIEAVRQAQLASMALMKPGVSADAIDRRAHEVLAGEAHAFGHGLGHGIGLQVHERPFLSPTDHTALRAGMVITNEPGIYIPDWGGVRLEEMVLVTETEPEVLTTASLEVGVG
ncbi:MAG TPA: Xaa-Pro peptidase family protein [Candidatus Dormibacteraeota bacterium]|nr:Xaa-Pro peptidase family protein [Candidatus Dormibacteraeota bacterium]